MSATEFTAPGIGIRSRPPRGRRPDVMRQLLSGPHLAVFDHGLAVGAFTVAFDAGLYDLRDAAPRGIARVRLTTWVF